MKKTLVFGLIAAVLGFTACNKENPTQGENTKGMVLHATVEQPAEVRATINNETAEWKFAFAQNDVIKVTNSSPESGAYYTFTNNGTDFESEDAKITSNDEDWYAYFPSATIDLKNQPGTLEGVANLYALAGKTGEKTTGEEGLSITMSAKVAILKITNNWEGERDINVKCGSSTWVTGMKAKDGYADFELITSSEKQSLFGTTQLGTYYVAVPAGVKLQILDGDASLEFTKDTGLAAGKYYELTIGLPPITGTAKRIGNIDVPWVQLWENGPKFAVYNVGAEEVVGYGDHFSWGGSTPDCTTDYYDGFDDLPGEYDTATKLWGSNWRMPKDSEISELFNLDHCVKGGEWTENYQNTGINGYLFTGKGYYKDNSVFFPATGEYTKNGDTFEYDYLNRAGIYWASSYGGYTREELLGRYLIFNSGRREIGNENRSKCCSVRAVLKE